MMIQIELSGEVEQRLRRLAAERGLPLDEFARRVLEKEIPQSALAAEASAERPLRYIRGNIIGKYAHLGLSVSREVIEEARQEMWANFPREHPKLP
jgi:hypothetical protein